MACLLHHILGRRNFKLSIRLDQKPVAGLFCSMSGDSCHSQYDSAVDYSLDPAVGFQTS
jgi:hypothetical protein